MCINGKHHKAGDTVNVAEQDGYYLINGGRATELVAKDTKKK